MMPASVAAATRSGHSGNLAPSAAYSSLGLGLYIAREIVRAHGGAIDVASNEEVGTTFTVYLRRQS